MITPTHRRLKNLPYHSEHMYALIRNNNGRTEMCHVLGTSVADVWAKVIHSEIFGPEYDTDSLREFGWVARPVFVEEQGT